MDKTTAIDQIKKSCQAISLELMRLHPPANAIDEKEIRDEIFKTLFEFTKNVETLKKLMRKLELKMSGDPDVGDVPPVL